VRSASEFGQPCPQVDQSTNGVIGSEDCLTLNVWTPTARSSGLPVLVFMHGGDNYWGSSTGRTSDGLFDGATIAASGPAVVVTFDYRLGALGFLALAAFAQESPETTTGDWALLDQIAALEWVQNNIAAFGGDPNKVLLFGQSAGSYDTCALLTSPLTAGLFQRAIMESGPCWIPPHSDIELGVSSVLTAVGCSSATDQAACLRAVPAETLAALPVSMSDDQGLHKYFYPSVDGYVLTDVPMHALTNGHFHNMPMIFGTNAQEMTTLLPTVQFGAPLTASEYNSLVVDAVGVSQALNVERAYASDPLLSYNTAALELTGDLFFHCRTRRTVRAVATSQSEPVWRYLYAHSIANGSADGLPLSSYGAGHGLELLVVFGDHRDPTQPIWWQPTPAESNLSSWMAQTWTQFAATGTIADPTGGIVWAPYDPTSDNHIVIDEQLSTANGVDRDHCDFWDTIDMP
jgi:para-nitrobenzyl esterase